MNKISLAEARGLLKAAMETQGRDFVYNAGGVGYCINVPLEDAPAGDPRSKTGCIVGTAMSHSQRIPNMSLYMAGEVTVFHHFLTNSAMDYFGVAQNRQDNGSTWGDAFDAAEEWAALACPEDEA